MNCIDIISTPCFLWLCFQRSIYIHLFTSFRSLTFVNFNICMTLSTLFLNDWPIHCYGHYPHKTAPYTRSFGAGLMLPFDTTLVTAIIVLSSVTIVLASLEFCTDRISITLWVQLMAYKVSYFIATLISMLYACTVHCSLLSSILCYAGTMLW